MTIACTPPFRPARAATPWLFAALLIVAPASAPAQDDLARLLDQARQEYNAGRHAAGLATYDRAIDLVTRQHGPHARQLVEVLALKGYAHAMIGEREQARALTGRAVAIVERASGPDSRDAVVSRLMLGAMHVNFGEIDQAKALYAKAVADARAKFGDTDATTLQVAESAAQALLRCGAVAEAVRLRRLVLAGQERARGKDAMETIAARSNLAHFLHSAGDVAGAEQAFEETLRSLERRGMNQSGEAAAVRSNLGAMLSQRGEHAKALAVLELALEGFVRSEGQDAPAVSTIRNNVAVAKLELGRADEALADYREIVAACERTAGPDDPRTLTAVNNLAGVLARLQRAAEAVPLFERVAAGLRRTAPVNDPRVLSADANLAATYKLVGRGAEAVRIGAATVAAREEILPPGHTDIGDALGNLADSLMFTGDAARAVEMTDRQQRCCRIRDARILAALTDAEQATFLAAHTIPELEQALNVAGQSRDVPEAAERSAAWLANSKGRGVEATAARARLLRAAANPAATTRVVELATVRRQMAMLAQQVPQADGEQVRGQLETLADRERALVRELGVAVGDDAAGEWVGIEAIRAALPPRTVLVDLARFKRLDFRVVATGKRLHEERYVAWIVPPVGVGAVGVVDLGEADAIDAAVATYRRALQAAAAAAARDPAAIGAEAEARLNARAGRPLAERLLDPIMEAARRAVDTVDELVIAPDGPLWLVPWAALPDAAGEYLVERHAVRLVTSGRELALERDAGVDPPGAGESGRPLVFAAPDFDLAPDGLVAALADADVAARTAAARDGAAPPVLTRRANVPELPRAQPLPGTRAEVATIAPALEAFTGAAPEIFLGGVAQETVLKRRAVRPRALVLATHGYFLEQRRTAPGSAPESAATAIAVNPLLRCGLLLAGANTAAAPRAADLDDGVLTGLEVTGLDLAGTALVVLSACDTGVGDVLAGEGMAGLRQAFQIAGAKRVVATLWQVPDAESARIMQAFYARLAAGLPAARALREAQVAFIAARREDRAAGESAHPFLWAAYGVTGR